MQTTLTAADGHEFDCWMQQANGEARGNLIILQEIFGVTDQLKGIAERYALQGLNVAIPALFDRQQHGAVFAFDQPQGGRDLMDTADLAGVMADIQATAAAMRAQGGKVAVMGFCWGGGLAVNAALKHDVACAVAFYGTRMPDYLAGAGQSSTPILAHFGIHDAHTPATMIQQVREALPQMAMFIYDAGHAFANDQRPASYKADIAELAHQRTAAFLAQHLAG